MSYYNQPDHERLDRRDDEARTFLLRLARGQVTTTAVSVAPVIVEGDWFAYAAARGVPAPDAEPLTIEGVRVPLVWRDHYVAALPVADLAIGAPLEDLGFAVVLLGPAAESWPDATARVLALLGRTPA
jgi:hypothetical protein